MTSNGSGAVTFKYLVPVLGIVLLALLTFIGGTLIADTREKIKDVKTEAVDNAKTNKAKIECLEKEKLDKDQYYRDMRDIKVSLSDINDKLDALRVRSR